MYRTLILHSAAGLLSIFAVAPASTNYTLKSYDFGSGGGTPSSTNYRLNGVSGTQTGSGQSSTNYKVESGVNPTIDADTPSAPAFYNPSNYYDRLQLELTLGSTPSDTKYLIAVSSDNFATTSYVQADHSLGPGQSASAYRTYAAWGGAGGFQVLGLQSSTTYKVKVKALQGDFTNSAFGPTASASTVAPSIAVSLSTTLTGTPPFSVAFSSLTPGAVTAGNADAVIGLTTNALSGGAVYISDSNAGLTSPSASATINSTSTDLASAPNGYGAQIIAAGQTSGGPFSSQPPFNGASDSIGGLSSTLQPILSSAAPVTSASGTVRLKAKASATTPSAADYNDTVTFTASMNY